MLAAINVVKSVIISSFRTSYNLWLLMHSKSRRGSKKKKKDKLDKFAHQHEVMQVNKHCIFDWFKLINIAFFDWFKLINIAFWLVYYYY